jgi:hypothetical protein
MVEISWLQFNFLMCGFIGGLCGVFISLIASKKLLERYYIRNLRIKDCTLQYILKYSKEIMDLNKIISNIQHEIHIMNDKNKSGD